MPICMLNWHLRPDCFVVEEGTTSGVCPVQCLPQFPKDQRTFFNTYTFFPLFLTVLQVALNVMKLMCKQRHLHWLIFFQCSKTASAEIEPWFSEPSLSLTCNGLVDLQSTTTANISSDSCIQYSMPQYSMFQRSPDTSTLPMFCASNFSSSHHCFLIAMELHLLNNPV